MAIVMNRLIELQGKAKPVNICRLVGPNDEAVQIWGLSDGATIILKGRKVRSDPRESKSIFDTVERVDKPFKKVVASAKRKLTLSRKRMEVNR